MNSTLEVTNWDAIDTAIRAVLNVTTEFDYINRSHYMSAACIVAFVDKIDNEYTEVLREHMLRCMKSGLVK